MSTTRRLRGLLAQAVLIHAAYGAARPMISYRALDLGAGNSELGLLAASFSIVPLLLAFSLGRRADLFGPARLVRIGALALALGAGLAIAVDSVAVLVLASALLGLAHLMGMIGQQAVVAGSTVDADRDRGFGSLTAAASVGQMVGPAVAMGVAGHLVAEREQTGVGLMVVTLLALSALPFGRGLGAVTVDPAHSADPSRSPGALRALLRTHGMWQAMVVSGAVLAALDLLLAFLPAWAEERGISVATVGWLLALRAAVSVVTRLGVVWLIRTLTRRGTLVGSLVCGVVGLAGLPYAGVPGAAGLMVLLGVGLGMAQPLTLTWVTARSTDRLRGAALGLRLTANRLAQTVLPPGIGAVAAGGTRMVFLATAGVLGIATATALRAPLTGDDPTGDDRTGAAPPLDQ